MSIENFKNPWDVGGEYYPDWLGGEKVLGSEGILGKHKNVAPVYINLNTTYQGPNVEKLILPKIAENGEEVIFLYNPIFQGNTPYKGSIVQVKYVFNKYDDKWNRGRWIRTEMISYNGKLKADGEISVFGQGLEPLESFAGLATTIPNAGLQGSGFDSFEAFVSNFEITQPIVLDDGTIVRPPIVPPNYDIVRVYFNSKITVRDEVLSALNSRGINMSKVIFYHYPFNYSTGLKDSLNTSDFILDFAKIN